VNRRALFSSLGALLFSAAAALAVSRLMSKRKARPGAGPARVVSLSPALTETLLALGSGSALVGISDFCEVPPSSKLPRVGTALTPNYEAIAALEPTLILSDGSVGSKGRALGELAPCEILPWLTLAEVVESTRRLGALVARQVEANALADKLQTRLSRQPPPNAPRVLLLLSYDPARPHELWFIKRNSLHGAALAAAGARNAVDRDVPGLPKLGVEELVALDPDRILILPRPGSSSSPERQRELVSAFGRTIPVRAAREGRIEAIQGTQSVGPSILRLVDALEQALVTGARRE
jgi:ABC-type Fe3+-hydroxamate transport system substrate-binding protein